jgi:hypothetical protein
MNASYGVEKPVEGLLREVLEAEAAGVLLYEAALMCAHDPSLKDEWERHRTQSARRAEVAEALLRALGLDPDEPTPGRLAVRDKVIASVDAILDVFAEDPAIAQIVAAECILDAERKCEFTWQLLAEIARHLDDEGPGELMRTAHEAVAPEFRVQVARAQARCRELWLDELGVRSARARPRANSVRATC